MPKVTEVKKAAKAQNNCGSCGKEIAKGAPYKWLKKRHGTKKVRCPDCAFRASDHTGGRLGEVYAAQETACDAVAGWDGDDVSDLETTLEELEGELETFADEYEESCENIRDHFSESDKADECEEKAEQLREWQGEVESARGDLEPFDPEYEEELDCSVCSGQSTLIHQSEGQYECSVEGCGGDRQLDETDTKNGDGHTQDEWREEQRSKAQDAANECTL
jgi:DNA-directed RNA polymerase subunit RPC12/RpoP